MYYGEAIQPIKLKLQIVKIKPPGLLSHQVSSNSEEVMRELLLNWHGITQNEYHVPWLDYMVYMYVLSTHLTVPWWTNIYADLHS